MAGVTIDEVVLATVRFICNDHDVVPVRQNGRLAAQRQKLLDGCENDPTRRTAAQSHDQIFAAIRLLGRLAQDLGAAREGAEELPVQVVAVRDDDDRRVLHRRVHRQQQATRPPRATCGCQSH